MCLPVAWLHCVHVYMYDRQNLGIDKCLKKKKTQQYVLQLILETINPPFHLLSTLFWSSSADSTASVVVLRKGFSRLTQDVYHLPIEINDNGFPAMSSTNTLTIRVCSCDSKNTILSCNVEPYVLPAGLSTGALIAILACIVILLGKEKHPTIMVANHRFGWLVLFLQMEYTQFLIFTVLLKKRRVKN